MNDKKEADVIFPYNFQPNNKAKWGGAILFLVSIKTINFRQSI